MLSSRNILNVKIVDVKTSELISLVYAKLENNKIFKALITSDSAKELKLKPNNNALMIFKAGSIVVAKNDCKVKTSSANELNGNIKSIQEGSVYVVIDIDCDGILLTASITMQSYEKMKLKIGDNVNVLIKATNVMVGIKE